MNRRSFIAKTSLTAVGIAASLHSNSFIREGKIKIGLIGCGWYGMVITKAALKTGDVEVIAVCDVDSEHLKTSASEIEKLQGSRPREFKDYRELLETKGLQTIFIGTPPHWHALQFIAACEKGYDIYCEKPLAYDVREGQAMVKAAQKAGNIVQIGFQRRQSKAFQKAKELIKAGEIGNVNQISVQIHYNPVLSDHTVQAPPASLDWETWCGPAPKLDYRPSIGHKAWRLEKEYGNGHFVDWGIHNIDIIRNIMGFGIPKSFDATGGIIVHKGKITTPDTLNVMLGFENCPVFWQHRLWGTGELNTQFNNGVIFYGEKASLFASDDKLVLMRQGKDQKQEETIIQTPAMQDNHVAAFVAAVKQKNKKLITCTVEDGFMSTATVQLAMASYYSGSKVIWDADKNQIVANKAASKLLARPYRAGYKRPE